MKYPVRRFVIPDALAKYPNGKLPKFVLGGNEQIGELWAPAAWWMGMMMKAAERDGIKLYRVSNGYRDYERQYALFMERMSDKPTARKPPVTRVFNKRTYWLKVNAAPVASPGKSIHGWGCAQDLATQNPKVLEWLRKNAPTYGWFWECDEKLPNGKPNPNFEPWHLIFCYSGGN